MVDVAFIPVSRRCYTVTSVEDIGRVIGCMIFRWSNCLTCFVKVLGLHFAVVSCVLVVGYL